MKWQSAREKPLGQVTVTARWATTIAAIASLAACAVSTPYTTPEGLALRDSLETRSSVFIAITEIDFAASDMKRATFNRYMTDVEANLPHQIGFIGFTKRMELFGSKAWTMTIWEDIGSMTAFMYGPDHARAVEGTKKQAISARFVNFEIASTTAPISWGDALARLGLEGRSYQ